MAKVAAEWAGYVCSVTPSLVSDEEFMSTPLKEAAADYFLLVDARLSPLIKRINSFTVQPGSELPEDDNASRTDAVCHRRQCGRTVEPDGEGECAARVRGVHICSVMRLNARARIIARGLANCCAERLD